MAQLSLGCDGSQKAHAEQLPEVVYTWWAVLTEVCYLLRHQQELIKQLIEMVYEGYYELLDTPSEEIT